MKVRPTAEHERIAAASLGYGPDVVMNGAARNKIKSTASKAARGRVFMEADNSVDRVKELLREKIQAEKRGKKSANAGKNGALMDSSYAYIREVDPDNKRVVYECGGKMYGRDYSVSGNDVKLGDEVEVKEKKTYETV